MAGKAVLQRIDLLAHGAGVADDAARPVEHPLAFRGEALEARAALHQQHPERILELLDAGRERGLAHAAGLGRMAEMPLARQRDDEFELVDHAARALPLTPMPGAGIVVRRRDFINSEGGRHSGPRVDRRHGAPAYCCAFFSFFLR